MKDSRLQEQNIVLHSLRDYFDNVVVPRRFHAKLNDIEFLDDSRIYAYTIIRGEKYLLYYLINSADGWKIGFY